MFYYVYRWDNENIANYELLESLSNDLPLTLFSHPGSFIEFKIIVNHIYMAGKTITVMDVIPRPNPEAVMITCDIGSFGCAKNAKFTPHHDLFTDVMIPLYDSSVTDVLTKIYRGITDKDYPFPIEELLRIKGHAYALVSLADEIMYSKIYTDKKRSDVNEIHQAF